MHSDRKSEISVPWHLGIVFQGIIVAFTIFLGRVYVLTYHETLGIPVSERQLSAIDYAVVSPGVTVIGIGISIMVGSYFLLRGPVVRLQLPKGYKVVLGSSFAVVGLVIMIVFLNADFDSVIRSLWIVLSLAMGLYGGAMLGSALSPKAKRDDPGSEQERVEEKAASSLLFGVAVIVLVVLYGTYAYRFSHSTAHDDAIDALHQSPQATVQFTSGDTGNYRVIMIGGQFVYLLPEESEGLQAFPLNSIEKVDYAGR